MAYSQTDPRWASVPLNGDTYWTIGRGGCLLTAFCNVALQYGHDITPPQMQLELLNRGINTLNLGGVDLVKVYPDITYRGFVSMPVTIDLNVLNIDEQPGVEGIVKMDYSPVAGIQTHFSRLRGVDPAGNVVIDDSYGGNRVLINQAYRNQNEVIWGVDLYYKAAPPPPPPPTTTTTTTTTLITTTTTSTSRSTSTSHSTSTSTSTSTTTSTTTTIIVFPPPPQSIWSIIWAYIKEFFMGFKI